MFIFNIFTLHIKKYKFFLFKKLLRCIFYDIFLLVIELKKKNILLLSVVVILLIVFVFIVSTTIKMKNEQKNYITYISVSKLQEKINNKDDFVLVFTQDGCSHCATYYEVINSVAKDYDLKIYDINLTDVKDKDIETLNSIVHFSGTPTTLFYIDGEEQTTLNRINGSTSKTNLINKLKKLGYIKE